MIAISRNVIVSGIQPTGELHIGNYFGAIANWLRFQTHHRSFFMIADLHAMTLPYQPDQLRRNTEQLIIDLIACGVGGDAATLFLQSLVPEHTELCWLLSCVCSFGDLTRQTQFKEKSQPEDSDAPGRFISAALFHYPVLQSADILAYHGTLIPVGKDQLQHLELTRDIVRRFNYLFGEFFAEPQPLQTQTPKIMSLVHPDRKMSKQNGPKHYIGIFEDEGSIRAKVRSAVTDSGVLEAGVEMSEGVENLFSILRACGGTAEADHLYADYQRGNRSYMRLKDAVSEALITTLRPLHGRRRELMRDSGAVLAQVARMSEEARETAGETVREVRKVMGLPPRS